MEEKPWATVTGAGGVKTRSPEARQRLTFQRTERSTALQDKGSCTPSLRLIPATCKPGKIPSCQYLYEGVLPWSPLFFSTSWCWSPWRGCASCSIGRGPATPPPCVRRHRSPQAHGPSAAVSPHPLRASPKNLIATPVSTAVTLAHRHPHPH